jgi:hypothetical protein
MSLRGFATLAVCSSKGVSGELRCRIIEHLLHDAKLKLDTRDGTSVEVLDSLGMATTIDVGLFYAALRAGADATFTTWSEGERNMAAWCRWSAPAWLITFLVGELPERARKRATSTFRAMVLEQPPDAAVLRAVVDLAGSSESFDWDSFCSDDASVALMPPTGLGLPAAEQSRLAHLPLPTRTTRMGRSVWHEWK